jgi:hypothetical protein
VNRAAPVAPAPQTLGAEPVVPAVNRAEQAAPVAPVVPAVNRAEQVVPVGMVRLQVLQLRRSARL